MSDTKKCIEEFIAGFEYCEDVAYTSSARVRAEAERRNPPAPADGLCCPRCGGTFHDSDVQAHPADYWTCPTCGVIEHVRCRGSLFTLSINGMWDLLRQAADVLEDELHGRGKRRTVVEVHNRLRAAIPSAQKVTRRSFEEVGKEEDSDPLRPTVQERLDHERDLKGDR